jgi:hypothetical protein
VDALADRGGGDRAAREPLVERAVHVGVEDQPPRARQLVAVAGRERRSRAAEDRDVCGQRRRIDVELVALDQVLEVGARQRVALRVRHVKADAGQPAMVLDHTADDAVVQDDGRHACELGIESVHRSI